MLVRMQVIAEVAKNVTTIMIAITDTEGKSSPPGGIIIHVANK